MPCNTVRTVKLELKDANVHIMREALEKRGYQGVQVYGEDLVTWVGGSYSNKSGKIETRSEDTAKDVRTAYSAQTVRNKVKAFGWKVKQTSSTGFDIIK